MSRKRGVCVAGALVLAPLTLGCTTADDLIATLRPMGGQAGEPMVEPSGSGGMAGAAVVEPSPCALEPGAMAPLARYDFEDADGATTLHDAAGLLDAQLMEGAFSPVPGPTGCGTALAFEAAGVFAQIPNLPEWDLNEGSIDFWLRVPDVAGSYGILGRDHLGTDTTGHLSFWLTPDNTVTARLQGAVAHGTHCSEAALAPGAWVHIGFNFGAPGSELWVDGVLAARTGDPRIETIVPECGTTTNDGIAGNEQPWVLGYDTSRSGDALDGLLQHFDGGAIDALQISLGRRDFQRP